MDRSPYLDALNERGENTHHIAFIVPSIDAHLETARAANPDLSLLLAADLPGNVARFVYVEGLIPGAVAELIKMKPKALQQLSASS